jgi:hypothetical protein
MAFDGFRVNVVNGNTNVGVTEIDVSGGQTGLTTIGGPITSSGTITLDGTLLPRAGGTGLSVLPANNQVLIGTGAGYAVKTLTAGDNVSISSTTSTVVISATGTVTPGTLSITAGTGLSADGTPGAAITAVGTLSITPTAVSSGAYGGASSVPTLQVNSQGQLEAVASVPISLDGGTF